MKKEAKLYSNDEKEDMENMKTKEVNFVQAMKKGEWKT
jgi:hypothetical protein